MWIECNQGLVPAAPSHAGTEHLEQALGLVRGRPFAGVHPRQAASENPWRSVVSASPIW